MYTEIIKRMKKINLRYQIAAGVILVICGTLVLLSDYIKDKRDVVFSEMNLALSSMNMDDSLNNQDENIDNVEENKGENPNYTYEEYLGIIYIRDFIIRILILIMLSLIYMFYRNLIILILKVVILL